MTTARLFIDSRNSLGEGPIWHDGRQALFWFEIHSGTLFSARADGQIVGEWTFGEPAAAAGIIDDQHIGVVTASGLFKVNLDSNSRELIVGVERDNPATRCNDSRVGPGGGFWIGTMARNEAGAAGAVYHYRAGTLQTLVPTVQIPNSICFSPDGATAYFTDSPTKRILKRSIDPQTALPTGPFELFRDTSAEPGVPDGSVVDAEGFVWNARYNGSCVIRYSPDGQVDRVIDVPVPQVTCPALGGSDFKTLYVTTASQGMSAEQIAVYPQSGSVFCADVDVPGLPEHRLVI